MRRQFTTPRKMELTRSRVKLAEAVQRKRPDQESSLRDTLTQRIEKWKEAYQLWLEPCINHALGDERYKERAELQEEMRAREALIAAAGLLSGDEVRILLHMRPGLTTLDGRMPRRFTALLIARKERQSHRKSGRQLDLQKKLIFMRSLIFLYLHHFHYVSHIPAK